MPDWLKWKKGKLLKPKAVEPVPFEINCVCGRLAAGHRVPRYQQVICLDCGEPLFILPLNPYPAPRPGGDQPKSGSTTSVDARANPKSKSKPRTTQKPATKIDAPDDDPSAAAAAETAEPTSRKTSPKDKRAKKSIRKTDAVPVSKMKRPRKRFITPFRLTVLAIGGILAGTVWFSLKSSQFDKAEIQMREASAAGFEALQGDNIIGAAIQFRKAAEAAAVVAPQSNQAITLKQLQRQTEVVTRLSQQSIVDLLTEAAAAHERQPQAWKESITIGEDWVVIDSTAMLAVGSDGIRRTVIEFPLSLNEADVSIRCSADALAPIELTETPQRIIFAARIQQVEYQAAPAQWQLDLDSTDVVLWTDDQLFEAAGFKKDGSQWDLQTTEQLAKQKLAMGISE
ncbi:hypothetical protein OAH18_00305 [bacterium]|nr:hypothetical protein [bacterium]